MLFVVAASLQRIRLNKLGLPKFFQSVPGPLRSATQQLRKRTLVSPLIRRLWARISLTSENGSMARTSPVPAATRAPTCGNYVHTLPRTPEGWRCTGMTYTVVYARGNEKVREYVPEG